jgi:hypothetical protein
MVRYRRNFVPGGTYFFTVTLADRAPSALLEAALDFVGGGADPDLASLHPGYLLLATC